MPSKKVDVAIIGGGPGGYVAAIRAAQLGKKTLLIEKDQVGGTCLNVGCIPSKAIIHAADVFEEMSHADSMGIEAKGVKVHMEKIQAWKQKVVKRLTTGVAGLCKNNGAEIMLGEASFLNRNSLEVKTAKGKEKVEFQKCIIATGSDFIRLKDFPVDEKQVLSSTGALALKELPKHLIVLGGGYIGLELGMAFAKLGSQLTVIEAMDQVLPNTDAELVAVVSRSLRKMKASVHVKAMAKSMKKTKTGVTIKVEKDGKSFEVKGSHLLVTVGRRPYSEGLALDKAGLRTDAKGFIKVNVHLQTAVSRIYAIGDVAGGALLAHKASYEGEIAAEHIAHGKAAADYKSVPWAIFTSPEVAGVGLTEAEAKKQGRDILIGKFPFTASGRALSVGQTDGFVKVVADKNTKTLLGISMVGPDVSNLISEGTLAVELGAELSDIGLTMHVHPTLPESLMEAAKHALGEAIHTMNK